MIRTITPMNLCLSHGTRLHSPSKSSSLAHARILDYFAFGVTDRHTVYLHLVALCGCHLLQLADEVHSSFGYLALVLVLILFQLMACALLCAFAHIDVFVIVVEAPLHFTDASHRFYSLPKPVDDILLWLRCACLEFDVAG